MTVAFHRQKFHYNLKGIGTLKNNFNVDVSSIFVSKEAEH